jgi:hypothetical protein
MGSFEWTCAVTRCPIFEGDKVVLILPKIHIPALFYPVSTHWYHYGEFLGSFQAILHGTYDDYGWIKESERPEIENKDKLRPIMVFEHIWTNIKKFVGWDRTFYGRHIREYFDRIWDEYAHPFRSSVQDQYDLPFFEPLFSKEDAEGLCQLIMFADLCRIDLMGGDAFGGSQWLSAGDDMEFYKKMIQIMTEQVKKLEDRYNKKE